ncbi:MAG: amidohydrolase [Candidatus Kapabacteria bacterium]|nr:amidohydrolase [Candidatus Kapabacteria bacterium]MCS7169301.1 amidohydrolase [Candidatus Kapabacteria bacterium]MDW7996174.1 amidohydrolase [Bacteroidota bacterium]MDW8224407.1 amidohydrolase [Bacteroidota bacterium]
MQAQRVWLRVRNGRIQEVLPFENGVVVETEGDVDTYPHCWVLPGFVDAHGHVVRYGLELDQPQLHTCRSVEECIELLRRWSPNRGDWLLGGGWNQELWTPAHFPDAASLDVLFPDTPVALRRADGHALWVNTEALRRAGITDQTPDPPGGFFLRHPSGRPTGVLVDGAADLIFRHIPPPSPEEIRQAILHAAHQLLQYGVTEVHDMDVDPTWVPLFQELAQAGQLPIRVQSYVRAQRREWYTAGLLPTSGEFFRLRGVKFYADGALGSYGAALLEPYQDRPGHTGLLFFTVQALEEAVVEALEAGWDIAIHAIGDAANRQVAHVYRSVRRKGIAEVDQRLRVEHAQIVHPDDIPVLAEAGSIASVQPLHCVHDAAMARRRLGQGRSSIPYPWRSLLAAGIPLAAGSDFPIELPDVLMGIAAFCSRIPPSEESSWLPQECVNAKEALAAYTNWAHFAAAADDRRGLLLPGYDADLVVLDQNPAHCSLQELSAVRVVAVYISGVRGWQSKPSRRVV